MWTSTVQLLNICFIQYEVTELIECNSQAIEMNPGFNYDGINDGRSFQIIMQLDPNIILMAIKG